MPLGRENGGGRPHMNAKSERSHDWHEFMLRMAHQFEQLLGSRPSCLEDIVQELRKQDESITFLEPLRRLAANLQGTETDVLSTTMQHHGYYASVQGSWLVCSKNKKQHDAMLFAAQAFQVLAEANMTLVPTRRSDSEAVDQRDAA
jgi:hypothetical protein